MRYGITSKTTRYSRQPVVSTFRHREEATYELRNGSSVVLVFKPSGEGSELLRHGESILETFAGEE
jgi:hypothetical protein